MQTIESSSIDKSAWGNGPWQQEPDRKQWPDAKTGLPCLAIRHSHYGHWCGYVAITEDHPLFGRDYMDVPASPHYGLTFSGMTPGSGHVSSISDKEPTHLWWFGFDCMHFMDFAPGMEAMIRISGAAGQTIPKQVYRTLAFVEHECARLARQLARKRATINKSPHLIRLAKGENNV